MNTKPAWQSKTIWLNGAVFVLALAIYIVRGIQAGEFSAWISVDQETIAMVLTLLNLILRFVTTQPITVSGNPGGS